MHRLTVTDAPVQGMLADVCGANAACQHICEDAGWAHLLVTVGGAVVQELLTKCSVYCAVGGAFLQVCGCPAATVARKRVKVRQAFTA